MDSAAPQRLRAQQRVKRNADFQAVRAQGRRIECGAFLLTWCRRQAPANATQPRVGVVASRASVGDAVHRNRAKRRLREVFRRHQESVPAGVDVVLTARPAALRLELPEMERRFVEACGRIAPPAHA